MELWEQASIFLKIKYCCGACGVPLDEHLNRLEVPDGYDPDRYPKNYCGCQETNHEPVYITREMALDAGYPEMEGQQWS